MGNSYQNHPDLVRSRPMHLNGNRCYSSSAEAGVLVPITYHLSTPLIGGTHYHRQWASRAIIIPTREARPILLIRWLLIHLLVVLPSGTNLYRKKSSLTWL
ncbi:hypothetical protein AVEN_161052-1 [Araneus ventricosus]|uniref:Uncharacterized protein n=1 Tax=Araneus ventricosus TaxID=182803 RepID=A0A4Y2DYL8_ARAVE|nr:hypothetical protein AVEN_161052-1 [Araneus ventricosus]